MGDPYFGIPTALVVRASGGGRILRVEDGGTAIGVAGTNGGGVVSDRIPQEVNEYVAPQAVEDFLVIVGLGGLFGRK